MMPRCWRPSIILSMHRIIHIGLCLSLILAGSCACKSDKAPQPAVPVEKAYELSVMSFNVRYLQGDAGTANSWDHRKAGVMAMLRDKKPMVIGTQEGYVAQIKDILKEAPAYGAYYVPRDGENVDNETNGILYLKDSIAVTYDRGTFWLSETPAKRSMGWDAACSRICSWMKLYVKSSRQAFYVFNTHLDHVGEVARAEGLKLIWSRIREINTEGLPVFLTGDFNTTIEDGIFKEIPYPSARLAAPVTDQTPSYNGFGKGSAAIDHIFFDGMQAEVFETVDGKYGETDYISDHYPVMCTFSYTVK